MKILKGCITLGALFALTFPASATLVQFDLFDHPDGTEAPPTYGLRLDDPSTSDTNTFHFDSVIGIFDTDTNQLHVTGSVEHIQTGEFYDIEAWMLFDNPINVAQLLNPAGGFDELVGHTQSLTLDGHGSFAPTEWTGWGMGADPTEDNVHIGTGHRGVGNTLSGWGWLAPTATYPNGHVNSQDWLFTMDNGTVVPEPTTIALLGMGVAGLAAHRRRSIAKAGVKA